MNARNDPTSVSIATLTQPAYAVITKCALVWSVSVKSAGLAATPVPSTKLMAMTWFPTIGAHGKQQPSKQS